MSITIESGASIDARTKKAISSQIRRAERRAAIKTAIADCAASLLAIAAFFVLMFFVEG